MEKLQQAKAVYFTDYLGLDVVSITDLRRRFFESEVEYRVAKNTLIKLAAQRVKLEGVEPFLSGPTALALSYDDPADPARVLKAFTRDHDRPTVKGILFEGRVLEGSQVEQIAALPSPEILMGQFLSTLTQPLNRLVGTLNAPLARLAALLGQLMEQKA